tara:strand:+ start:688 stop:801 length:114 start_codon:yes stop_codon:yes gene_type:complete
MELKLKLDRKEIQLKDVFTPRITPNSRVTPLASGLRY